MSTREGACIVWVAGNELSLATLRKLRSVQITDPENKAKSGTLVFEDTDFSLFDSKVFKKGRRISVLVGVLDQMCMHGPFVVKAYSLSGQADAVPLLTVKIQDKSHRMNKKQKRKRHLGNPVDVLKKIASAHGLGYDVNSIGDLVFTDDFPLIQANITDAALIQRLAERYGYVWGIEGDTLTFRKPEDSLTKNQTSARVLSYRFNDYSVQSFQLESKFMSARKRTAAKKEISNDDLLGDSSFDAIFGREQSDAEIGSIVGVDADRELDPDDDEISDEERDSDLGDTATDLDVGTDSVVSDFDYAEEIDGVAIIDDGADSDGVDPVIETEPGDDSGVASPDTEVEAQRRARASVLKSTETVKGSVVPSEIAEYRAGQSIILAGIGVRLSGKYRIQEVATSFRATGQTVSQSLKVMKRSFYTDSATRKLIAKVTDEILKSEGYSAPGSSGATVTRPSWDIGYPGKSKSSSEGQPQKISRVGIVEYRDTGGISSVESIGGKPVKHASASTAKVDGDDEGGSDLFGGLSSLLDTETDEGA